MGMSQESGICLRYLQQNPIPLTLLLVLRKWKCRFGGSKCLIKNGLLKEVRAGTKPHPSIKKYPPEQTILPPKVNKTTDNT